MSKYITRVFAPFSKFKEISDYVETNSPVEIDLITFELAETYPCKPTVNVYTNKPVIKNSTYLFYSMNYVAYTEPNEIEFLTIEESEELDKNYPNITDSSNNTLKRK